MSVLISTDNANPAPTTVMATSIGTTEQLLDRFLEVRELTDALAARLSAGDQTPQSMPDASPTKWHRGHTSWFFEEFLLAGVADYQAFDPAYRYLFNSYYEAVGPRHPRPQRGLVTRPGAVEVGRYRDHVTAEVAAAARSGAFTGDRLGILELGCHHEQQHQELLLMDAKHLLSINPTSPVYVERAADEASSRAASTHPAAAPVQRWQRMDGGLYEVGHDGRGFAFDNEGPRHRSWLDPYEIATRQVTNAEWIEFIDDGGYQRPGLWLSDGWRTVNENGWDSPGYWLQEDGGWSTFTLSGRRPVVADEPVAHVSFYEADAFAHWAGARLATEHEWEVAARSWAPPGEGGLLDPRRCHPGTATERRVGDVWEWTSSAYLPYPGFTAAPGAVGEYNGKFMSDQHVLRGASAVTPRGHQRVTYRNFFPASARWAFSGVRLARGVHA